MDVLTNRGPPRGPRPVIFICQFILLGAVLNRMLIGEPETGGAVASPGEAREETRGARAAERVRGSQTS